MKMKRLMLLLLLLLGVGFAAVSTTLVVTGNVMIGTNNEDFDVRFTKAVLDGEDISSAAISGDGKTITFEAKDLSIVDDVSKLDFDVTNYSEMYDTEVSVECVVGDANKEYYQISKEVATLISGKATEVGKVEVKLVKASVDDRTGTFKCTLKATAKERTRRAVTYYAFGDPLTAVDATTNYETLKYPGRDTQAKVFTRLDADGIHKSVCIVRNNNLECFRGGSTTAYVADEQEHLRRVFSDGVCEDGGYFVGCTTDDFNCNVNSDGNVYCSDYNNFLSCDLKPSDVVNCG